MSLVSASAGAAKSPAATTTASIETLRFIKKSSLRDVSRAFDALECLRLSLMVRRAVKTAAPANES